MEALTKIYDVLREKYIYVPSYQRAYSWDTSGDGKERKHVNTFLSDLTDYISSGTSTKYYFGHFLFESNNSKDGYAVIDGQQRLTTISIFINALFRVLKDKREFTEDEQFIYEDTVKRGTGIYRFKTVDYDNSFYRDYVVERVKTDRNGIDTVSQERIADAYDYFVNVLSDKDECELTKLLQVVCEANCTTHIVYNTAEAVQMFLFQNNRGKKPTNLEIIKAQFMHHVHINAKDDVEREDLLKEISSRFETIYRRISELENKVYEDEVLSNTLRVYFNSLNEDNPLEKIGKNLEEGENLQFVKEFSFSLEQSFDCMKELFKIEKTNITLHSLLMVAKWSILMPFMIKALRNGKKEKFDEMLCSFECLFVRNSVVRTRADLMSRLNKLFQDFDGNGQMVVDHIEWMKTAQGWWGFWNNESFNDSLDKQVLSRWTAKFLLWHYENHLIENGVKGYLPIRYEKIKEPHLEHIAPQTPTNGEPVAAGYDEYDEEFKTKYIDTIGNYLLLSAPHNEHIGNRSFVDVKRPTYTQLRQQFEIRDLTDNSKPENDCKWDRNKIKNRDDKIKAFIKSKF